MGTDGNPIHTGRLNTFAEHSRAVDLHGLTQNGELIPGAVQVRHRSHHIAGVSYVSGGAMAGSRRQGSYRDDLPDLELACRALAAIDLDLRLRQAVLDPIDKDTAEGGDPTESEHPRPSGALDTRGASFAPGKRHHGDDSCANQGGPEESGDVLQSHIGSRQLFSLGCDRHRHPGGSSAPRPLLGTASAARSATHPCAPEKPGLPVPGSYGIPSRRC